MAFQVAVCLLFVSPTQKDISFDTMIKNVKENISKSTGDENKLPKVHQKLGEMAFHVLKKAITAFTDGSFEFHTQKSDSIPA